MRTHQQPAYILINRPYSETSWIVEVFSREYGRMALMAKGARRIKSKLKSVLMPFQPTLLSWSGKGEVPTLTAAEIDLSDINVYIQEMTGDALVCGFYCNELLTRLLHRHDPHQALYDRYHQTIIALSDPVNDQRLSSVLRSFERTIIKETGYEVNFTHESDGKTPLQDSGYYQFHAGQGFIRVPHPHNNTVSGSTIRAMAAGMDESTPLEQQAQGKRIMRDILRHSLGHKEIVSRALFYPKAKP